MEVCVEECCLRYVNTCTTSLSILIPVVFFFFFFFGRKYILLYGFQPKKSVYLFWLLKSTSDLLGSPPNSAPNLFYKCNAYTSQLSKFLLVYVNVFSRVIVLLQSFYIFSIYGLGLVSLLNFNSIRVFFFLSDYNSGS
ncbi:hypothetical protein L2E82_06600 [Cichorium intybus]|uniref:Uncharacterized protein n=1 Tax=Cichorium intybus TaxID=13427 RepID=A0ACB9HAH4_CICIN|nr:hypothetical protein L2E82_06600 [Cichorium intybus]